jgi:hypothetical protein
VFSCEQGVRRLFTAGQAKQEFSVAGKINEGNTQIFNAGLASKIMLAGDWPHASRRQQAV